jgi:threonine/homoserine/homoserine lactone efflux protein
MVFSPGPMTMLLMGIGIEHGLKKTMPAQLGASSAYCISLLIFAVGLTSLLQQYTLVLKTIQYVGVAYILYLAYKQWQNSNKVTTTITVSDKTDSTVKCSKLYWRGLITGLSNPKTIVMFSTVIPQFVAKNSNKTISLTILSAIFLFLQFLSGITYSYFGQGIKLFLQHETYQRVLYKSMAILLLLVAVMIARV